MSDRVYKVVKVGTIIRLKNAYDPIATVVGVCGDGEPTTTYMVRSMNGLDWVFRDQFTIFKASKN